MSGSKRSFPYHSQVGDIEVKKRNLGNNVPGLDITETEIFAEPNLSSVQQAGSTDFSKWSDKQLKGFLDQRGEDYDPGCNRTQLIQLAAYCEHQTGPAPPPSNEAEGATEEEADPLDAFMAEMNQLAEAQPDYNAVRRKADLSDEEDNVADFLEARAKQGTNNVFIAEGYNSDDEVYATDKAITAAQQQPEPEEPSKQIGPLAPLDHDNIDYQPFAKDFYTPVPKIGNMTAAQVNTVRRLLGIRVSGFDVPGPVDTFEQCGLEPLLMAVIRAAKYEKPTGIQAQGLPAALSGRDVLGIAKTGSGKTASFVIPMIVHIQDQPELQKGEGPIGVIVAPTRELAEQIHKEARRFGKPFNMAIAAGIGGLSKTDQFKSFKAGADAAVCTPGRLIDLIKMKACKLDRTTYLVFDEADRMFDLGFEPQVRSIIGQVRPDRQTLLYSATMPNKVEKLVRDALTSPVRITVGELGAANEDIKQIVEIVPDSQKIQWLLQRLPDMIDIGEVLVFVNQIVHVEEVVQKIKDANHRVTAIHGDLDQHSRAVALKEFSAGRQQVLVATDVAARGLDIKSIKNVVNLDAAKDIDTHVHRVGRTGRAGDKEGVAYTLLTPKQTHFAGQLVNSMVAANQEISPALQSLAMKDQKFKKGQTRQKKGSIQGPAGAKRRGQVGGAGIGFGPGGSNAGGDTMQELYGDRTGFTKGSQAAPSGAGVSLVPPKSTGSSILGGPYGAAGRAPVAAPPPEPRSQAPQGFQPASTPQTRETLSIVPPRQDAKPPGAGGVFGGQGFKEIMSNKFMSKFVASGSTGGDQNQRATIIAPKAAARPQEVSAVPSFLAKKIGSSQSDSQTQQAIAAARAIAARLAGGSSEPSSQSLPAPPPGPSFPRHSVGGASSVSYASRGRGRGGGGRHSNAPAGLGSSASAYPDLSRSRGRDSDSDSDSSSERRHRSRRTNDHYSDRRDIPSSQRSSSHHTAGHHAAQPLPPGPPPAHSSFAASPTIPSQVTPAAPPSQTASWIQPAGAALPQAAYQPSYAPPVQASAPPSATPQPPGPSSNIQASIAAAQAIAARLSAQAGVPGGAPSGPFSNSAPPPAYAAPSQPRLNPPQPRPPASQSDSVQAAIEAAKAIAARMSSGMNTGGPGGGTLGGTASSAASGQWAWRKG